MKLKGSDFEGCLIQPIFVASAVRFDEDAVKSLYPGFAGFVPSGRVAVFPECVHKPCEFGSTVFETAIVCVTSQTMVV